MPLIKDAKRVLLRQALPFFAILNLKFLRRHKRASLHFILGWISRIVLLISIFLFLKSNTLFYFLLLSGILAIRTIPVSKLWLKLGMVGLQLLYLLFWLFLLF
jgi:hypothetical protein